MGLLGWFRCVDAVCEGVQLGDRSFSSLDCQSSSTKDLDEIDTKEKRMKTKKMKILNKENADIAMKLGISMKVMLKKRLLVLAGIVHQLHW